MKLPIHRDYMFSSISIPSSLINIISNLSYSNLYIFIYLYLSLDLLWERLQTAANSLRIQRQLIRLPKANPSAFHVQVPQLLEEERVMYWVFDIGILSLRIDALLYLFGRFGYAADQLGVGIRVALMNHDNDDNNNKIWNI